MTKAGCKDEQYLPFPLSHSGCWFSRYPKPRQPLSVSVWCCGLDRAPLLSHSTGLMRDCQSGPECPASAQAASTKHHNPCCWCVCVGGGVAGQPPVVACTLNYWLSLYPEIRVLSDLHRGGVEWILCHAVSSISSGLESDRPQRTWKSPSICAALKRIIHLAQWEVFIFYYCIKLQWVFHLESCLM